MGTYSFNKSFEKIGSPGSFTLTLDKLPPYWEKPNLIPTDNVELLLKETVYADDAKNALVVVGPMTSFKKLTPKLIPFS